MHKTNKILTNQNDRYFDREISWLSFNQRVLLQAYDETIPFGERLRYICISSGNLDEFYMVRVAGVYAQLKEKIKHQTIDGLTPKEQLKKIKQKTNELLKKSNENLGANIKCSN